MGTIVGAIIGLLLLFYFVVVVPALLVTATIKSSRERRARIEGDDLGRMLKELILEVQDFYPSKTLKIGDYSDEDLIYYNVHVSCGYRYIEACDPSSPPKRIFGIPIPFSGGVGERKLIFAIAKPLDDRAEVFDPRITTIAQEAIKVYNQETGRRVVLTHDVVEPW